MCLLILKTLPSTMLLTFISVTLNMTQATNNSVLYEYFLLSLSLSFIVLRGTLVIFRHVVIIVVQTKNGLIQILKLYAKQQ